MKTRIRHLFIALPLFLLLVGGILASTSAVASAHGLTAASPSNAPAEAVTSGPLNQDAAKVLAYWTPERMRSARPVDEPVVQGKFTPSTVQHGAPGATSLTTSNNNAFQVPHSYYSTFPYSTVGQVFFTDPRTGASEFCSGAALKSNNKSVVDTAGHCVIQGGSGNDWYTNWMFCPQYYNGTTPYGCWLSRLLASNKDWINSASREDDFGEAIVNQRMSLGRRYHDPVAMQLRY